MRPSDADVIESAVRDGAKGRPIEERQRAALGWIFDCLARSETMEFTADERHGRRFVAGTPGRQLLAGAADARLALEACFEHGVRALLLYSENLPDRFFDLSTGEAGAILQKLRDYGVRLAIVRAPGLRMSRRFDELLADEQRGSFFRMFEDRDAAEEWLVMADA